MTDDQHSDDELVFGNAEHRTDLFLDKPGDPTRAQTELFGLQHDVFGLDGDVADALLQLESRTLLVDIAQSLRDSRRRIGHADDEQRRARHPLLVVAHFCHLFSHLVSTDDDKPAGLRIAARRGEPGRLEQDGEVLIRNRNVFIFSYASSL